MNPILPVLTDRHPLKGIIEDSGSFMDGSFHPRIEVLLYEVVGQLGLRGRKDQIPLEVDHLAHQTADHRFVFRHECVQLH